MLTTDEDQTAAACSVCLQGKSLSSPVMAALIGKLRLVRRVAHELLSLEQHVFESSTVDTSQQSYV